MDEETSINLVTDVRLKRTVRDYLFNYGKTEDVFVERLKLTRVRFRTVRKRGQILGRPKMRYIRMS